MNIFKKKPVPTAADKMVLLTKEEEARQQIAKDLKRKEIQDAFTKSLYPKIMAEIEVAARKGYSSTRWDIPKLFDSLRVRVLCEMLNKDGFSASTDLCFFYPNPFRLGVQECKEVIFISWWRRKSL